MTRRCIALAALICSASALFAVTAGAQPAALYQGTNYNGRIERSEAQGQVAALFDVYDADGDGALSGAEATRGPLKFVAPPDLTYSAPLNIRLGGKLVEVIPMPTDHAPDNTVVRFVDGTNVLF